MNLWSKERLGAVSVGLDSLHLNCDVVCKSDGEVNTLCTALSLAQQWKIKVIFLPQSNMGFTAWEVLREVACKGKVDVVVLLESALRATNNKQIRALWQATTKGGSWWSHDDSYKTLAAKNEGRKGLQKLLAKRNDQ